MKLAQGNKYITDKYREYLKSKEWEDKRGIAFIMARFRCSVCSSTKSLNAHHLYYKKLIDVDPKTELLVLCGQCHDLAHAINAKKMSKSNAIALINKYLRPSKPKKRKTNKPLNSKNRMRKWIIENQYESSTGFLVVDCEDLKDFLGL